jgi:hypothetical protein
MIATAGGGKLFSAAVRPGMWAPRRLRAWQPSLGPFVRDDRCQLPRWRAKRLGELRFAGIELKRRQAEQVAWNLQIHAARHKQECPRASERTHEQPELEHDVVSWRTRCLAAARNGVVPRGDQDGEVTKANLRPALRGPLWGT